MIKEKLNDEEEKFSKRKHLEKLLKLIDKMQSSIKSENKKIVYDFLVQNLKEEEFLRTFAKLKDIDFADCTVMKTLFEYKKQDEYDQDELANEVIKEYHSGRLDPLRNVRQLKKKKKEKISKIDD